MGFLTKYGTQYGDIPQTLGRIFFVAPSASYTVEGRAYSASDDNDGLSPERALLTIQRAINLCGTGATGGSVSDIGDVIMLLNGTHTVTATINVNVAGITIWGVASDEAMFPRNGWGKTIVTSTGTSDELFNITVSRVELAFFTVRGTSAFSCFSFQTESALDSLYFHDLIFDMDSLAPSLQTRGLDFGNRVGGVSQNRVGPESTRPATAYCERLHFFSRGAQGEAVHIATAHVVMRDCRIHLTSGTWASPFVVATGADHCLLERVIWTTSGTMNTGITGHAGANQANGVCLVDCRFQITTDDIEGFGAGELDTITTYEPTSGGTLSTLS